MTTRVLVWNENIHERTNPTVGTIYPDGIHGCIAAALNRHDDIDATTATLQDPEHGLSVDRLEQTDVILWWGHVAHDDIDDAVVARLAEQVWAGLGLIMLHSAHFSKIFKRLMGTPCNLRWREAGERERLWITSPAHPIARDLPANLTLENEEMYGEPFGVPEPLETVFLSWFQGGEVFRSGLTYRRGAGHIFYFRPGHETYPTYHDETIQQILANAVRWAHNPCVRITNVTEAPNVPFDQAPEPINARGASVHDDNG